MTQVAAALFVELLQDMIPAKSIGQRFSHSYLDRSATLSDKETFRIRLGAHLIDIVERYGGETPSTKKYAIAKILTREIGVPVPVVGGSFSLPVFFKTASIEHTLDAITIVWRYLDENLKSYRNRGFVALAADEWQKCVMRILEEECMSYTVDEKCGVHFKVDRQFDHDKINTLRCLDTPRYDGVRSAFCDAIRHLDGTPVDTKAAVRSVFEAVEILVRLITPCKNLHRKLAETTLAEIVSGACAKDVTAEQSAARVMASFGDWVDAVHFYRHGQGEHEPVSPPLGLAIFIFSSGASYLRWLVEIDKASLRHDANR